VLRPCHGECPFQPAGRVPHTATLVGRYKRGGIHQPTDRVVRLPVGHQIRPVTDGRVWRPMDREVRQLTDSSAAFPQPGKCGSPGPLFSCSLCENPALCRRGDRGWAATAFSPAVARRAFARRRVMDAQCAQPATARLPPCGLEPSGGGPSPRLREARRRVGGSVDAPDGFFTTPAGGGNKDSTNSLPRSFDNVQRLGGCDSKQTSSQSSTVRS
jgi:hypothetical protein